MSALKKQLNINNAISMLVWAQFYSANDLFDQTMKFVVENFSEIFWSARMGRVDEESPLSMPPYYLNVTRS
jgi:hypothetical protein